MRPPSVPMAQWVSAYDAHRVKVGSGAMDPLFTSNAALDGADNASCIDATPERTGADGLNEDLPHDTDPLVWDLGWESILECVQEAGDILFIPSGWHHGVLNTQESVGIALELGDNVRLVDAVLRDVE